jgi:hypothetical protein
MAPKGRPPGRKNKPKTAPTTTVFSSSPPPEDSIVESSWKKLHDAALKTSQLRLTKGAYVGIKYDRSTAMDRYRGLQNRLEKKNNAVKNCKEVSDKFVEESEQKLNAGIKHLGLSEVELLEIRPAVSAIRNEVHYTVQRQTDELKIAHEQTVKMQGAVENTNQTNDKLNNKVSELLCCLKMLCSI